MEIIGLFFVVFAVLLLTNYLGFNGKAQMIGAIMGVGTYILIVIGT